MRTLVLGALAALLAAITGCKSSAPGTGGAGAVDDVSCDANPDPHCTNPINRVLVPMLRAANMPIRDAGPKEFCRRAYVDLVGRIPTTTELAGCITQKPGDAVDALMKLPDYPVVQARWWGQTFGYDLNNAKNWYLDIYDLDALVRQAYAIESTLAYADFATRVVMHPAFYSIHQNDDWAKAIWQIFLGRTARLDEVESFRPLSMIWGNRLFCDGTLWWETWKDYDAGVAAAFCDINNGYLFYEWDADFCNCDPSQNAVGCATSVLGQPIDFGSEGCVNLAAPADPSNLVRLTEHPAGSHTRCPDGTSIPECNDRWYDDDTGTLAGTLPVAPLPTSSQAARLDQLGHALAARPDFWEAAANSEIKRFIGWWQQGTRKPDYDVPDVRTALAAQLQSGGSLPAIEKLIVTSLLYDAPADPPNGATGDTASNPPLWSMGPSKFLGAEMWLDSAAVATMGTVAGTCDYRFLTGGYPGLEDGSMQDATYGCFVDAKLVTRAPAPLAAEGIDANAYYLLAPSLGGCNPEASRPLASTVGVVYAQHSLALALCAYGTQVLPAGFDASDSSDAALGADTSWMVQRAWSRDPTPAELATLVGDMKQCLAAGSAGCPSPESAARWSCARIIDSAPFALY